MARPTFGGLREAWKGEARDFTPLLAQQLDLVGEAIGQKLDPLGESEVASAGGRSIDIVAQGGGVEFVIENQYGRADHDHLTRALAYAVDRDARGLVVIAEAHRDEFREVAQYLNEVAEDAERGIAVWLVEARAIRIEGSPWAPLFNAVVSPTWFSSDPATTKVSKKSLTLEEFLAQCETRGIREAAEAITAQWTVRGYSIWRTPKYIGLAAPGPSANGLRTTISLYPDGSVLIAFGAFRGTNSGIPIEALTTDEFGERAAAIFGVDSARAFGQTPPGWLAPDRVDDVLAFAQEVADAYAGVLGEDDAT